MLSCGAVTHWHWKKFLGIVITCLVMPGEAMDAHVRLESTAEVGTVLVPAVIESLCACLVARRGAKDNTSDLHMYGRTKLFNIMSSNELNRRLAGTGVESYACHPGVAKTDLYRKMDKDEKLSAKVGGCPPVDAAPYPAQVGRNGGNEHSPQSAARSHGAFPESRWFLQARPARAAP